MAIREIIRMGHPTLRQAAEPYPVESIGSPAFDQLVEDLTDTLAASGGIGLAAPQINERVQVALVHIPGGPHRYGDLETVPLTIYVNPVIRVLDDSRQGYWEGVCRFLDSVDSWFARSASRLLLRQGRQAPAHGGDWFYGHRFPTRIRSPSSKSLYRPHRGFKASSIRRSIPRARCG